MSKSFHTKELYFYTTLLFPYPGIVIFVDVIVTFLLLSVICNWSQFVIGNLYLGCQDWCSSGIIFRTFDVHYIHHWLTLNDLYGWCLCQLLCWKLKISVFWMVWSYNCIIRHYFETYPVKHKWFPESNQMYFCLFLPGMRMVDGGGWVVQRNFSGGLLNC